MNDALTALKELVMTFRSMLGPQIAEHYTEYNKALEVLAQAGYSFNAHGVLIKLDSSVPPCTCSPILPWDSDWCPRHG